MKKPSPPTAQSDASMRLDKWLWAARFYKTRALAVEEILKGRVQVNGQPCKPARDIRCGDTIALRQGQMPRTVTVQALSAQRGPAIIAQTLYAETAESLALRQALAEQRRFAPEPAHSLQQGRPTKRDRRQLQHARQHLHNEAAADAWNGRWSASLKDD
ncbi:MAG: RNA-binding S4 domain-containing protein [Brachymonas sp.]|nr:RNA-binding S4 domain-containing protein [Brachymonas sp.]